jgi:hypothetical protein
MRRYPIEGLCRRVFSVVPPCTCINRPKGVAIVHSSLLSSSNSNFVPMHRDVGLREESVSGLTSQQVLNSGEMINLALDCFVEGGKVPYPFDVIILLGDQEAAGDPFWMTLVFKNANRNWAPKIILETLNGEIERCDTRGTDRKFLYELPGESFRQNIDQGCHKKIGVFGEETKERLLQLCRDTRI